MTNKKDYKDGWRYIVWEEGNDNYYKTFSLAQMDYHNSRVKGYDVCLTEIQKDGSEKVILSSEDEQELDTLVECSQKAEDVKLGDMENWLDNQLSNNNLSSKEHEHIFKLYNSISDIRTFYAQHLFNKKESV